MNVKTFVFIDLETTGLRNYKHAAKITEICLIAINRCHLLPKQIPRILNKLNLCFYPNKQIPSHVSDLTGLCNDSLEYIQPFSTLSYELIDKFLKHQETPVCLVAHNGFNFDYFVLNDELKQLGKKLPGDVLCIDTLPAFRHIFQSSPIKIQQNNMEYDNDLFDSISQDMDLLKTVESLEKNMNISVISKFDSITKHQQLINETTPKKTATSSNNIKLKNKKTGVIDEDMVDASVRCNPNARRKLDFNQEKPKSYKLCDIYNFIFKQDMPTAHQAEYDVYALMKCCSELRNAFLEYADNNCKSLNAFYSD